MSKRLKLFLLIIMISFLGGKVSAEYDKLAYDFSFKDLDGSVLNLSEYKGSNCRRDKCSKSMWLYKSI